MLKLYDNNLVGYFKTGISEFGDFGYDTEEWYHKNASAQPKDWKYLIDKVSYDRNSSGHRSTEFNPAEDYFLFVGCSLTVGSSVAVEHTYPYLVAKKYNVSYYNLAVEGAGIDLVCYNLGTWLENNPAPKRIFVQWPEEYRTFRIKGNDVIPIGLWSDETLRQIKELHLDVENFNNIIHTDYFKHFGDMLKLTTRSLREITEINDFEIKDYGRDLKHPGIESHKALAEQL